MNMVFDHGYLNVFSIEGPDYDTQLVAIRNLLFRQGKADQELEKQIDAMGAVAANDRAVDEWVDLLHTSIYQDAAHSMAAVGMIAPFFESMFGRLLRNMGRELDRKDLKRKGIGEKIIVHLKEAGLLPYLPDGLDSTLLALFAYRNRMFHNGFEWPQKECSKFEKSIEKRPHGQRIGSRKLRSETTHGCSICRLRSSNTAFKRWRKYLRGSRGSSQRMKRLLFPLDPARG